MRWHRRPRRRELEAEAALWRERCERANEQNRAEGVRAKAAEKRVRELEEVLARGLAEPPRDQACAKIRFHRMEEADAFRLELAARSGEPPTALSVYKCKHCPRSPVTMHPYWHVGHDGRRGRAVRQDSKARRIDERVAAEHSGTLLGQRVTPEVLAKLRAAAGRGTQP